MNDRQNSSYDIFFSYNSLDHAAVLAVATALRERGRSVFLDRWYLMPGRPWPQTLAIVASSSDAHWEQSQRLTRNRLKSRTKVGLNFSQDRNR